MEVTARIASSLSEGSSTFSLFILALCLVCSLGRGPGFRAKAGVMQANPFRGHCLHDPKDGKRQSDKNREESCRKPFHHFLSGVRRSF